MSAQTLASTHVVEPVDFDAADGRRLAGDRVRPVGPVRAQVIVHGATAVPRSHYLPFAKHLAESGFEVLIYDYRGVGGSAIDDPRRDPATMSDWLTLDAPAAVRALRARDRGTPLLAVGHSFGGQIAAVLEGVDAPHAIATMGAQRGYWATFPWPARPRMFLNWYVLLPLLTSSFGYLPGRAGLGLDMPSGIVREWARWCRHPDYYLGDHPSLAERLARYDGRLLALSVTDDDFAPLENVEWLLARHRRATIEHLRFQPSDLGVGAFGHFGFFRDRYADSVWPEVVGFFDEALGQGHRPRRLDRTSSARLALDDAELRVDLEYGRG